MVPKAKELMLAVETLSVLSTIDGLSNNKDLSQEARAFKSISTETLRVLNNVSEAIVTEDESSHKQLDVFKTFLVSKLQSDYCNVIGNIYYDITNFKRQVSDLQERAVELGKKVDRLKDSKDIPLLSSIKPTESMLKIMNNEGVDFSSSNSLISAWSGLILTPIFSLLKQAIEYFYIESSSSNDRLSCNFSPLFNIHKAIDEEVIGFKKLTIRYESSDSQNPYSVLDSFKRAVIDLNEIPNRTIKHDVMTQSRMSMVDWMSYNSKPRSTNDYTVIKPIDKSNCEHFLKELNTSLDQLASIDFDFFYEYEAESTLKQIISLKNDQITDKKIYLLELLTSIVWLYENTNFHIVTHMFNVLNAMLEYIDRSINLYDY